MVLEHKNHEPTPSKSRCISMFRKEEMTPVVCRRLFNDLESGITVPQSRRALAREQNGIKNFAPTDRDLRNWVDKERRRKLKIEGGDAKVMYAYLQRMSQDNPDFYHAYRVDDFGRLKDVMWVDARSRVVFREFPDVVCFDSTYITNQYELPFANFVGVNHHGQTILLGCALLAHENAETFEWLFREWLNCMDGLAPKALLTNQDAAIRKAVNMVFTETRHRWCLWHIVMKFAKRLSCYGTYDQFSPLLLNAIYDSLTPEEFEESWSKVVNDFKIQDDDWLNGMFDVLPHCILIFVYFEKYFQDSELISRFRSNCLLI